MQYRIDNNMIDKLHKALNRSMRSIDYTKLVLRVGISVKTIVDSISDGYIKEL